MTFQQTCQQLPKVPPNQLNPTNPEVYDILEKMYSEFYEMFEYDTFHIGGDEVRTF